MSKEMWEGLQGLSSDEKDRRLLHILKANPNSMGVAQRVHDLAEKNGTAEEAALERMANLQRADYINQNSFDELNNDLSHINTREKLI